MVEIDSICRVTNSSYPSLNGAIVKVIAKHIETSYPNRIEINFCRLMIINSPEGSTGIVTLRESELTE